MHQLNTIALRITAHAEGHETLRVSEVQVMRRTCEGVMVVEGFEDKDVRFADFLLAVIVRLENGQGIRPAHRG